MPSAATTAPSGDPIAGTFRWRRSRPRHRLAATVVTAIAAATLSGCTGTSCEQLPALQAEREERREAYLELATRGATTLEQTGRADDELHAFERRVYDIEQSCASR